MRRALLLVMVVAGCKDDAPTRTPPPIAKVAPLDAAPAIARAPLDAAAPPDASIVDAAIPIDAARAAAKPTTCLDEVECLVAAQPPRCCAKYDKRRGPPPGPLPPGSDVPDTVDAAMVRTAVAKLQRALDDCGTEHPATGAVRLAVEVDADGRVTAVTVKETPDGALGACAAGVMKRAKFEPTERGGKFTYPIRY